MKLTTTRFFNILTLCLITLTFSTIVFSQRTTKDLDKDLFLEGEFGNTKKFVSIERRMIIYDKASNPSRIRSLPHQIGDQSRPARLDECSSHRIDLKARFMYAENQKELDPEVVEIILNSQRGYGFYFKKEKKRFLTIKADKQKYDLGTMEVVKSRTDSQYNVNRMKNCPEKLEKLRIEIPAATFIKIVESKKIRIKIANLNMRISLNKDIAALRKLAIELQK